MNSLILLLAEDNEVIPYRKSLRQLAGSVTATILLQQALFRAKNKDWQPFYKFKAPCDHKFYKPGDSWAEELGFSVKEFDNALKKIGTKIKTGMSKADILAGTTPDCVIMYWTGRDRVTWYEVNRDLLSKLLKGIYVDDQREFTRKTTKGDLDSLTETTTETTTEINTPPQKISPNGKPKLDPVEHLLQAKADGVSEKTGPYPDDQWWGARDKATEIHTRYNNGTKPGEAERIKLVELSEKPDFDLALLEKSYIEAGANRSPKHGLPPVARVIEVYEAGGDYEKFAAKKWPPEEGKNVATTASNLTPEQKAASRERDAEAYG